jgi:hypothetical protein
VVPTAVLVECLSGRPQHVAIAEPSGSVLTGDIGDLRALAAHTADVSVIRV